MRALILVAGASLAISACGTKEESENAVAAGDNLAAEAIIANDTTAIDAATGDAANIAADVDYSVNLTEGDDSDSADSGKRATRPRPSEPAAASIADSETTPDETAVDTNGA